MFETRVYSDFNGVTDNIERLRQQQWVLATKQVLLENESSTGIINGLKEDFFSLTLGRKPDEFIPDLLENFKTQFGDFFTPDFSEILQRRNKLISEIVGDDFRNWPKAAGLKEFIEYCIEANNNKKGTVIVTSLIVTNMH
jgi:hypothetical protein